MANKTFFKSRFSKNVAVLTSGTALSQLIPFIVLPILQKYYYGPSDFAALAVFVYFSELVGSIATLKLEFAIVVQSSEEKAKQVMLVAMRSVMITTLFSFLLATLFFQWNIIHSLFLLGNTIFLLPLVVLSMGIIQISSYWFNRKKMYAKIARGKVVQTTSGESGKLILGWSGVNYSGLILGRVGGYIINAIWQGTQTLKQISTIKVSKLNIRETLKNNYQYIAYATPSVFISALINFIYIQLFFNYFGGQSAGMVSVAMTYVGAGLGMVASSIGQVFYGTIAEIHDRKILYTMYLRFVRTLFFMALMITLLFWILPASWVVGVLGENWDSLMEYCKIISIWFSFWFIASSLSFIYMRLQKQGFMLMMDFLHIGLIIAGFFIGKSMNDEIGALWGVTIVQAIFYTAAILLALFFIKKSPLLKN